MNSKKDVLKSVRQRKYLNKTRDAMLADLLEYARSYYEGKIQDFSEVSVGGLFLDFASHVGDTMSYYLDHQFTELDPELAVEQTNIERQLRLSGVEIRGSAPAVSEIKFYIEIQASNNNILTTGIPIIKQDTIVSAQNGTRYYLTEDIDFNDVKQDGSYSADVTIGNTDSSGNVTSFVMARNGTCISGEIETETFSLGTFTSFKAITLSNPNVSQIVSVTDALGNVYYEVDHLTQDVVYKSTSNSHAEEESVDDVLELIPAPYRFTKVTDLASRMTTLIFGGGSADSLEDDVIPDPTEFAIPLYGKTTFPRLTLDPQQMLQTRTLGVIAENTTLSITYRYGGGLSHNAEPNSITNVSTLLMTFPNSPTAAVANAVRLSTRVNNEKETLGGEDAPTIDELKLEIIPARNAQSRIVSKPDLLSFIYRLPTNFGRVYRAASHTNQNNPLASQLFIVSRNANKQLTISPDTLKKNISKYINQYRLISDAIDVLDSQIINVTLEFECISDVGIQNKKILLQQILTKLKRYFDISKVQIDKSIIVADVQNIIFNTTGIVSVSPDRIKFKNINGTVDDRTYSDVVFDVSANTKSGIIYPPIGGVFEVRYPDDDIIGTII